MPARSSYPKGARKREEILGEVLEVMSRVGYGRASMKELAQAVGLSVAGLQHHFPTKDELYAAVLAERDEIDRRRDARGSAHDAFSGFRAGVSHNLQVTGLVELYVRFSAEATANEHPAHEYFAQRLRTVRGQLAAGFADAKSRGELRDDVDPERAAEMLLALTDGAQLHWLLDEVDMVRIVDSFLALLRP